MAESTSVQAAGIEDYAKKNHWSRWESPTTSSWLGAVRGRKSAGNQSLRSGTDKIV